MSDELNLEAERELFIQAYKVEYPGFSQRAAMMAFEQEPGAMWLAARRTPPVSAPLDTQALPPLPTKEYFGIEMAGVDMHGYTDEQMREYAANAIAPYAARIAHLERELKQAKLQQLADIGQDIERGPAQSIGNDPEFRSLLYKYWKIAGQSDPEKCPEGIALIAYIDGRTAGTAPLDPVEGDLLPPVGSRVLIHLARQDAWVEHTVAGYYVWGALSHQVREGEKHAHRVFVRVKDANGYDNARLLSEVRPVAAAPSPQSKQEEAE